MEFKHDGYGLNSSIYTNMRLEFKKVDFLQWLEKLSYLIIIDFFWFELVSGVYMVGRIPYYINSLKYEIYTLFAKIDSIFIKKFYKEISVVLQLC